MEVFLYYALVVYAALSWSFVFESCFFHHGWEARYDFLNLGSLVDILLKKFPFFDQVILVYQSPHFLLMTKVFVHVSCDALLCNSVNLFLSIFHLVC